MMERQHREETNGKEKPCSLMKQHDHSRYRRVEKCQGVRRASLSKTLCEPVFQRKVGDVLKVAGIMCHERRAMAFRDGGNQGVFFSCRPAHAQQLRAEGPVDSRGLRVKRYDFDACHEFGQHVQIVRDTLRTERPIVEFAQHDGTHCQVIGMGSYPILNGHNAFQRRHTYVGIEMVGHSLGE